MTVFPIMITPEAMDAAAAERNREVARTNQFIREAYEALKKGQKAEPRKYEVLDAAQVLAEKARQSDQSHELRSIEYYLKSRSLTEMGRLDEAMKTTGFDFGLTDYAAFQLICSLGDGWRARMVIFVLGTVANLGYDFIKALAFAGDWVGDGLFDTGTYLRDKLRSGPTPITPPGGSLDGIGGAFDGMFEDGQERGMPKLREMIDRSRLSPYRSEPAVPQMAMVDRREGAGDSLGSRSGLVQGAAHRVLSHGVTRGRDSQSLGLG